MSPGDGDDAQRGDASAPRENDHLVEPFYSGLGLKQGAQENEEESPTITSGAPRVSWFDRLRRLLRISRVRR